MVPLFDERKMTSAERVYEFLPTLPRPHAATPIKPTPRRIIEEGSGTLVWVVQLVQVPVPVCPDCVPKLKTALVIVSLAVRPAILILNCIPDATNGSWLLLIIDPLALV